jgi:hypothetical protein
MQPRAVRAACAVAVLALPAALLPAATAVVPNG